MSAADRPMPTTARPFHRPILVAILSILLIIGGVIGTIVGILALLAGALIGGLLAGTAGLLVGAAIGAALLVLGVATLVAGLGLWRMRGWAWWLAIIVAVLEVVFYPGLLGKAVYVLVILYLVAVRKHFNQ